jgi:hypothetical protein
MENVVIVYDHLEYFMAIWYNVWQFGMLGPGKIWQPWFLPTYMYCDHYFRRFSPILVEKNICVFNEKNIATTLFPALCN